MELGIEGVEIEDKIPLSDQEKAAMFVDILPQTEDDDGVAYPDARHYGDDKHQEDQLEQCLLTKTGELIQNVVRRAVYLRPVDRVLYQNAVDVIHQHEQDGRCDDKRDKGLPDNLVDAFFLISVEHADGEHQDRVVPPLTLEPVRHYACGGVTREQTDRHHNEHYGCHYDYAGQGLSYLRENDPEYHIQYHDLYSDRRNCR